MQYILNQEEFNNLTPISNMRERDEALSIARKLILKESKFLCHHVMTEQQWEECNGYPPLCSDCPIGSFKSKNVGSYNMKNLICTLSKEYSK